jgi:predicted anti-sigma-YlaC factor YlaD
MIEAHCEECPAVHVLDTAVATRAQVLVQVASIRRRLPSSLARANAGIALRKVAA